MKVFYNRNKSDLVAASNLEGKEISDIGLKLHLNFTGTLATNTKRFKENDKIPYLVNYREHIINHFIQAPGDTYLKFIDEVTIEKQRGVLKHFLSKFSSNLLSGSGIMNISLPIKIFDARSLVEILAFQCTVAPDYLEAAGLEEDPVERLKLVYKSLLKL